MAKDWRSASRQRMTAVASGQAIRLSPWYESGVAGGAGAGGTEEDSMIFARLAASLLIASSLGIAGSSYAQTNPPPPPAPAPPSTAAPTPKPGDPFGEELTLTAKTIVVVKGVATLDSAFETILEAVNKIYAALYGRGIKPAGPAMTTYKTVDQTEFEYEIGVPVPEGTSGPFPEGISIGQSPTGKALKFVHRGSFDSVQGTWDHIDEVLEDRKLQPDGPYIEVYVTDLITTDENNLVIEILVLIR